MARETDRNTERILTTLGSATVFNGTMRFSRSLKINGHFNGEIISSGFLYIERNAVVTANIKVKSLVVGGVVRGDIVASDSLEILDSGEVYGNIKTSRLRIADGVIFEGKCEMMKDSESLDIFSGEVDKLKQTVQPLGNL